MSKKLFAAIIKTNQNFVRNYNDFPRLQQAQYQRKIFFSVFYKITANFCTVGAKYFSANIRTDITNL